MGTIIIFLISFMIWGKYEKKKPKQYKYIYKSKFTAKELALQAWRKELQEKGLTGRIIS